MRQPGVDLYLSVFGFESGRLGMGIMDPGSMVFWIYLTDGSAREHFSYDSLAMS